MKKFFTLIAMAFVAVCASAQTISWTEDDVTSAAGLDGQTYGSNGFVLTCTDTKTKMSIEKNSQYFGTADSYEHFTADLKTGGKSQTANSISLSIPSDGTLYVYARTGSNSDETRTVVLTQDGEELYNAVVKEADAVKVTIEETSKSVYPIISVAVKAGTVTVGYPVNTVKFYCFKFVSSSTGITSVISADATDNAPAFNIAGQRVSKDAKGLVIVNGKKHLNK